MEPLLSLLLYLLIGAVVLYAVYLILGLFPIPANIRTVIVVILALVFLLWALRALGLLAF